MPNNRLINEIISLHLKFLKRDPLSSEVSYWVQLYNSGHSPEQVRSEFFNSAEMNANLRDLFRSRHGNEPSPQELDRLRLDLIREEDLNAIRIPPGLTQPTLELEEKTDSCSLLRSYYS